MAHINYCSVVNSQYGCRRLHGNHHLVVQKCSSVCVCVCTCVYGICELVCVCMCTYVCVCVHINSGEYCYNSATSIDVKLIVPMTKV